MQSPRTTRTALLVVDLELGLTHPTAHGPTRSTPNLESNISNLLSSARSYNSSLPTSAFTTTTITTSAEGEGKDKGDPHPILIIHVHHHSRDPDSQLHPSHVIDWSPNPAINGRRGVDPLPCASPLASEDVLIKSVNSSFIGTDLEDLLRIHLVRQLVVVGMTTEHCISTTVRMAANLNVCSDPDGFGERRVVVVEDGCACFGKVGVNGRVWEAETVHAVEIECLRDEFALVMKTDEVVGFF